MSRQVRAGGGYVELGLRERLDAGLRSAEKKLRNFAKGAITIGGGMVGSAAAVIAPLLGAAGRAQEIRSKFDTVFGDANDQMREWGNNFAQQIGRSKTEVEQFLSGSQDLFVPLGFEPGAAREMSQTVTKLAFDLASFNNFKDADAMNDLQAALTGSGEVMKKYGVVLDETAVKQELMNNGINPQNATNAQKAHARLNIILEGTKAAQGDVIRTSGSFTNQLKALFAVASDLAVQLGEHLLPPATAVLKWLRMGVTYIGDFASRNEWLTKIIMGTAAAVGAIGAILVTVGGAAIAGSVLLGGLSTAIGAVAAIAGALAGPATVVIGVLAGVGAAAYVFRDRIKEWALAFWDWLAPVRRAVSQIAEVFTTTFAAVSAAMSGGDVTAATTALWTGVTALFFRGADIAGQAFEWLFGSATGWLKGISDALVSGDLSLAGDILWAQLSLAFISGQAVVMRGWHIFTASLSDSLGGAATLMQKIIGKVLGLIDKGIGAMRKVVAAASMAINAIKSIIDKMMGAIGKALSGMRKIIEAAVAVDPTGVAKKALAAFGDGKSALGKVSDTFSGDNKIANKALDNKRLSDREALAKKLDEIDQRVADARQKRDAALARAAAARGDKTFASEAEKRLKKLRDQAAEIGKIGDEQKKRDIDDQANAPFAVSGSKREGATFSGVGAFLLGLGSGEESAADITARNTTEMVGFLRMIAEKDTPSTSTYS